MSRSTSSAAAGESLVRAIGTLGLAAGVINITIGGGIFRLPALVAASLGPAAPLAYLVCALAISLIVFCIADAGSRVARTGGPYAYVGVAFGPYVGFLCGVLLWLTGIFATAAVSTVFASGIGLLVPALSGRAMEALVLIVCYAFWALVNLRGVRLGARLNAIATAAKLLPLLLVIVGGLFAIEPANLAIATMPPPGDVARMSLLLIFAFAGIEVALVPSGEIRDPARTVPRGLALAMAGITTIYIALQVVSQGVLGSKLADATASPLADVAAAALGGWARHVLLAGASISMFGYLGGMTLSMPRMLFALARDGYLPKTLAAVHPVYLTPHIAIPVQSGITLAVALTGTFERLAILANVSVLALYLGSALASWQLRRMGLQGGAAEAVLRVPFAPMMPWLACGVILWLLTGLTRGEVIGFAACVAIASLPYLFSRRASESANRSPDLG
ncbi:MAG TPA: amino acid permease [Vicinamibacterales bacterium]|nr:amino acid permease [Vicinamibacterales bacterium]